jgi:hypothetical protein
MGIGQEKIIDHFSDFLFQSAAVSGILYPVQQDVI